MSSSDKNFVRNLCFAAGLFFAFLLLAPIKFGPATPEPPVSQVEATTATAASVDNVPANLDSVPVTEEPESVAPPAEYLNIPLTIGENTYRFSVNKNKENIRELAAQVCNENAAGLGITTAADLEARCFDPVVASLSEQVDLTLEQVVEVDLDIDGRNVKFEIDAAIPTSIEDQANLFCINYGAEFGVTQETLAECTQNVVRALQDKLTPPAQQDDVAAPKFQADLDIQGRVVRFTVEATYESIGEQATTFCTTHGAEFGVTQETLGECQQNIQRALEEKIVVFLQSQQSQQSPEAPVDQQQHQPPSNPTFQTDLDIQGRVVRFMVEATYESIGEQATTFCTTHGAEFGVTQETLGECQQNIQRALEEKIVAYLSAN